MKIEDLPPRNRWFRPIKLIPICPAGDADRWLLISEWKRGCIAGVSFQVSGNLREETGNRIMGLLGRGAVEELLRRIEREEYHGEGCLWETFLWTPEIIKRKDGTYYLCQPAI